MMGYVFSFTMFEALLAKTCNQDVVKKSLIETLTEGRDFQICFSSFKMRTRGHCC